MEIIIDNVAIWRSLASDGLSIREVPKGKRYKKFNSDELIMSDRIFYRYAKNYTVGTGKNKVKYCLFVRTMSDDKVYVEGKLDEIAETITVEQAREVYEKEGYTDFEYLDILIFEPEPEPEPTPEPEPEPIEEAEVVEETNEEIEEKE